MTSKILNRLKSLGDPTIAAHSQRYFKTGKGEYGEGDVFMGIRMPVVRKCVREFRETSIEHTVALLQTEFHEARMLALLILVDKYERARTDADQNRIYKTYLAHTGRINNWDLVDCSAHKIVGHHLLNRDRGILYKLAKSKNLWERRISIISTFWFIRYGELDDTLALAEILLSDPEDLIHKAVGWVLREVGNKSFQTEDKFLKSRYKSMPRTMLRYAIEKFPEDRRQAYLKGIA
ncbi:MAG: DNA alkylation repair protein [Puniceicoccaceae bacterium]